MALALSEFEHMAPDRGPRVQASQLKYAPLLTPDWEWVQLYHRNGRNDRQPWVTSALLSCVQCRLKGAPAHASQNWAIHRTSQSGKKTCASFIAKVGPDPVYGRLTRIGAPTLRDNLILFAQVGYCHLLSREVPHNSQHKPLRFLKAYGWRSHMIQQ